MRSWKEGILEETGKEAGNVVIAATVASGVQNTGDGSRCRRLPMGG